MTMVVRPARAGDIDALYRMAKGTGGGFTNLPPWRPTLEAKLERTARCFAREGDGVEDELYLFVLEDSESGALRGTCMIFSRVGSQWPFYNYRIGTITQRSIELDRTIRAEMLTLCTDLDGTSEVGGLFLDPNERSGGVGKLLARSRYLFIRNHRSRFDDTTIAELRGAIDDAGNSPFWDGLAGRFFDMSFREADEFNAVHGNQFIADLMPKHPIYTNLLSDAARAVMGVPHRSGVPAMRMLEREGFRFDKYIDIFDGGPAVTVPTDRIRTIQDATSAKIAAIQDVPEGENALLAHGHLLSYRACHAPVMRSEDGLTVSAGTADALGADVGDSVTVVAA